jgi:hypothetical protein
MFAIPVLPAAAREEAEERENQDHDDDDPENAHCLPVLSSFGRGGSPSALVQRPSRDFGCGRIVVTQRTEAQISDE